ncbi:hypothetical protein Y900_028630 [Mycolicibacterium aromaticivorans JS19b1 = JCM 16368]|uniref:Uncharacterized protein n=1 Tax=Mycolicibacterium aromaticivorans JS19b1 = JCM 16368 TaxID=1440774 RepID=A0A064C995_9MYCO|nr:hypothetical protein Y900_028630 [Mycolicibacterium aromaticivorans JS19b1 = JCM 16368]
MLELGDHITRHTHSSADVAVRSDPFQSPICTPSGIPHDVSPSAALEVIDFPQDNRQEMHNVLTPKIGYVRCNIGVVEKRIRVDHETNRVIIARQELCQVAQIGEGHGELLLSFLYRRRDVVVAAAIANEPTLQMADAFV